MTPPREAARLAQVAAAFHSPGKLRALIGREKADAYFAKQREVADCRRRSATSDVLNLRLR